MLTFSVAAETFQVCFNHVMIVDAMEIIKHYETPYKSLDFRIQLMVIKTKGR